MTDSMSKRVEQIRSEYDNDAVITSADKINEYFNTLLSAIDSQTEENEEQRLEINETESEISKLTQDESGKGGLIEELRKKIRTRNNNLSDLESKVEGLEAENKELKEQSKNHWQDNQDTLKMLSESEDREMALEAKLKKVMIPIEMWSEALSLDEWHRGECKKLLKQIRGGPSSE